MTFNTVLTTITTFFKTITTPIGEPLSQDTMVSSEQEFDLFEDDVHIGENAGCCRPESYDYISTSCESGSTTASLYE